jgi:hypothetical protein
METDSNRIARLERLAMENLGALNALSLMMQALIATHSRPRDALVAFDLFLSNYETSALDLGFESGHPTGSPKLALDSLRPQAEFYRDALLAAIRY